MRDLILFGEMGAGKDEVARILKENFGYEIFKLGKKIHDDVDALSYTQNFDKRVGMQKYGQFCRELFGEDVWNVVTKNQIGAYRLGHYLGSGNTCSPVVIADGRQINERHFWKHRGFIPVGILADKELRKQRLIKRDGVDQSHRFNHDTEKQARFVVNNLCTWVINNNNNSLTDLERKVIGFIEELHRQEEEGNVDTLDRR